MAYLGNTPELQNFAAGADRFSGNASDTTFTLSRRVLNANDVIAYIESVPQDPFTAYTLAANTVSGTSNIVFDSAPPTGTNNIVVNYRATQIVSYGTVANTQLIGTLTTAQIADGAITADKIADGTIIAADIAANSIVVGDIAYNTASHFITTDGTRVLWQAQSALGIANTQISGRVTAAQISNTAVTPATYGGASTISVFTVDQQGRITSASNVTPSIANTQITGTTGTGFVTLNSAPILTNPSVTNYTETAFTANTGTAITINLANGTLQNLTCNASTTITLPASSAGKSFIIIVGYTGAFTVAWAGGSTIKWPGGTTPTATSTAGKYDIFSFFQDGINTYGQTFGLNY